MLKIVINKTKSRINWQTFSTLIALYMAISSIYPPLRAWSFYNLTWVVALGIWCIGTFLTLPTFFLKMPLQRAASLFFVIYTVAMPYFMGNPTIGNRFLSLALIPFFYWVYQYNIKTGNEKSNFTIIKWTLPFVLITCIRTGIGLLESPYLSRSIKSGGEYTMLLQQQGIGGYELIYFITIMSVLLLYILLNPKDLHVSYRRLILFISGLCLFIVVVVLSNYFTALIIILLSLLIMWILRKRSGLGKIMLFMIALLSVPFWQTIVFSALDGAIGILGPGRTLNGFMEIRKDILLGQGGSIFLLDRWPTIQNSLQALWDNPILGIVITPLSLEEGSLIGFGQHSQFMDTFALYGGLIGLLQIYFVLQPFVARIKGEQLLKNFSITVMVATIILFTVNNVTAATGLAIFLIYPATYDWIKEKLELGKKRINES